MVVAGSIVTAITSYPELWKGPNEFKNSTYENVTVLRSEKYDPPNTFRIPAFNQPHITERLLTLDFVSALEVNGQAAETLSANQIGTQVINVKGSKNNEYVVTVENGTAVKCTCPQNTFRRAVCKHMKSVEESMR